MSDYITMAEMNGLIPTAFLVQALDDDADGSADTAAWAAVLGAVHKEIDGALGGRFTVPFSNPLPAVVSQAAQLFAAELLYNRRGLVDEKNPWAKRAGDMRARLAQIGKGELPLAPEVTRAEPSASAVTEPSRTSSRRGRTGG